MELETATGFVDIKIWDLSNDTLLYDNTAFLPGWTAEDGLVGINDFLLLLAQWGGSGTCDIDGGGVGITDFLELLANWGPCP